ncbi:MAG TPA: chemotaxis-specific protein-glutamate methyltransferase CheB [Sphingomonas sp.]|jgi:two-component system chemotaxis response regulator CheB|nr:chemotaxis-specific protein-glutamate methyltransferase CheB [Sphingomonas sp.]
MSSFDHAFAVLNAEHSRVLIVDDSAVARAVMGRMIDASDDFVVARTVANVRAALDFLALERVEYILLDIQMPGIDGLTALPDILAAGRGARVVIVSTSASDGAVNTIQALAMGAADTLVKPGTGDLSSRFADALMEKLRRLASPAFVAAAALPAARVVPLPIAAPQPPAPPRPRANTDDYDIVAIGASTGGIHALSQLLRALPSSFTLPILVTQHLPTSFMPYFAAQLAVLAGRPAEVAVDRLRIRPGRVIVAPGDAHIRCVSLGDGTAAIRLSHEPAISGCMPSVDTMLSSLAPIYGVRMLAVILSGMGRDGAEGARLVHDAGGCVVVQDQASAVIWGMPGAVATAGNADAVLDPDAIGRLTASRRRP